MRVFTFQTSDILAKDNPVSAFFLNIQKQVIQPDLGKIGRAYRIISPSSSGRLEMAREKRI